MLSSLANPPSAPEQYMDKLVRLQGGSKRRRALRNTAIQRAEQLAYALTDIFFVFINTSAVFFFRNDPDLFSSPAFLAPPASLYPLPFQAYFGMLVVYASLIVLACEFQHLYRRFPRESALDESLAVGKAVVLATLVFTAFLFLSRTGTDVSRLVVIWCALLNAATLMAWRYWKRTFFEARLAAGHGTRKLLIVGAGKVGRALARQLEAEPQLGFRVTGFLDQNNYGDARVLGRLGELAKVARAHFVDEVLITIPSERAIVKQLVLEARCNKLNVKVVPELFDELGWHAPLEHLGAFPVLALHREEAPELRMGIKRLLDIALAGLGLLLTGPLLAVLAVLIKLDSRGPVFYGARRVGKKGTTFKCYKLRSMVADADARLMQVRHLNERKGPLFKVANDPRITRVGKALRKYSLDELPQLWNVLRGEMSIVGPRPAEVGEFQQYSLEHLRRLDIKPGITGLWQVSARRNPSFHSYMAYDLEYIEKWSLWLDVKILLRTVSMVVRGTGQ